MKRAFLGMIAAAVSGICVCLVHDFSHCADEDIEDAGHVAGVADSL